MNVGSLLLALMATRSAFGLGTVSPLGLKLIQGINDYRISEGKAALDISISLLTVAAEQNDNHIYALENGLLYGDERPECSPYQSWYAEPADASLYNPCCYESNHGNFYECAGVKPQEITDAWPNTFTNSGSGPLFARGYRSTEDCVNAWTSSSSSTLLRDSWRTIGCAATNRTDYSYDPAITPLYYCWFSSSSDPNPYVAEGNTPSPVTPSPVPSPKTAYDLVSDLNAYRVSEGKAAFQVSQAMMDVGFEHMDNVRYAYANGYDSWSGDCRQPFSWYDESAENGAQPWRSCCYPSNRDCTSTKAIEISCGDDSPYYYTLTPFAVRVTGYSYQQAVDYIIQYYGYLLTSNNYVAFGCNFDGDIGFYICYLGQKEDANTYTA